jgi:hypothetical protein
VFEEDDEDEKEEDIIIGNIQSIFVSKMGLRNYDNMENQDAILIDTISNKCKIYGMFDGHGEYGKVIAKTACRVFKGNKKLI